MSSVTVPPGPTGGEMLRALAGIRRDPVGFLGTCVRRYGDVVAFPAPRTPAWLVNDPAAVRRVLQDNHRNYDKRTVQYDALALVTGQGLLTSDPPLWLRQRRLVQPAFHASALDGVASHAARASGRVLAEWDGLSDGAVADVDDAMMRATLDVIAGALLGADLSGRAEPIVGSVLTALDTVVERARSPLRLPPAVPTPRNLRLRRSLRTLDAAVAGVVSARRAEEPAAAQRRTPDMLDLLLAARDSDDPGSGGMSERLLRDEIATMIIAGHETVASALSWAWHLLATHPRVQDQLHAELDAVLGERLPTYDDVARLPFTRAVLDETLRLYPPAWVLTRRAREDDVLAGHRLPAGSLVIISPWVLHRHPDVFADAEHFAPVRFLPDRRDEVPRGSYIPFGAGPRLCIGRDTALLEGVLVLAALARRRAVRPITGRAVRAEALVTLRPRGGMPLHLDRRGRPAIPGPESAGGPRRHATRSAPTDA